LAVACQSTPEKPGDFPGLSIDATCRTGGTKAHYSEVEGAYPGERSVGDAWNERFLAQAGELPLPCIDSRGETYRITQAGSGEFGGVLIVAVSKFDSDARIWAARWLPFSPGTHPRRGTRALASHEWQNITNELSSIRFWALPARLMPRPYDYGRSQWNGSWTIEGYRSQHYHFINRFGDDQLIRPVLESLLGLANPLLSPPDK
jgi:hypothetical protein